MQISNLKMSKNQPNQNNNKKSHNKKIPNIFLQINLFSNSKWKIKMKLMIPYKALVQYVC